MPEIQRIELERDNDAGVHEVKDRTRLDPVDPAPPKPGQKDRLEDEAEKERKRKEELERATTPFPGG